MTDENIFQPSEKQVQEKETGTGKSTIFISLMLQDIANNNGICLLDPREDAINDLIARIPAEQTDDVILRERRNDHDQ